ncbi:hypothetical protein K7P76_03090 [Cohnella sp. NL03-T5]|nr:hypothetical protein [Cohnella silvisoli]
MRKSTRFLIAALLVFLIAGCTNGNNTSLPTSGVQSSESPPAVSTDVPSTSSSESPPSNSSNNESPGNVPSTSPISSIEPVSMGKVTALRLANFKSGWAGGEGWIARTDDGGKSWKTQLQHKYIVNQLFALNDQQAWATLDIGDSKSLRLLHTSNGGKKWTEAGNVPNRAFLHFVNSNEAFSGNARTTDGGKTWVKLPVPSALAGDAYFHDHSNGWAVTQGKDKFSFTRTTDGGKTWRSVMTRTTVAPATGAVIRSAGKNNAWVELIGDSGMTQTSYSLFHTIDGGKSWIPVLAHSGAGSGPAPGYESGKETKVPANMGSGPGALYVVNTQVAFMGGQCMACDLTNTMGKTTDGGKTWINLKGAFPGYGPQQIAAADANHIWWINTDNAEPSVMYTSSDGGKHWNKVHTFDKPKQT